MSIAVSARISDKIVDELDLIANTTERSRTFHIQKALELYLEERADLQISLDRLHDTSDPIISINEMREKLNV